MLVESSALLDRTASMVLAVAAVYGSDIAEVNVRRDALTRLVGIFAGANELTTEFFGVLSDGLAKRAIKAIPMSKIHAVNDKTGKRILFKWRSQTNAQRALGAITLEVVLPAAIMATLNTTTQFGLAQALGRAAIHEFKRPTEDDPSPEDPGSEGVSEDEPIT